MAVLLPLPDDPRYPAIIEAWPSPYYQQQPWPRSAWLRDFEDLLRPSFPQSSSRDRKLTARHYAPFPLRDGHNVP